MVFAIDLLGRLVDAVSPWLARRGGAHSSGAMRRNCGLCRDSPPSTSALCAASGAFCAFLGGAGDVAISTAPGERYGGENGAVQPRITPSNAPSTPQPFGRKC